MRLKRSGVPFFFIAGCCLALFMACGKTPFSETISVLKKTYQEETKASRAYLEFSQKAHQESYPEIAYLFNALSLSESIHAGNARKLLEELRVKVAEIPKQEIKVRSTQENLHEAATNELNEIDRIYPELLQKIKPEGHAGAHRIITYAWESEKQHRDLIKKIKTVSGVSVTVVSRELKRTSMETPDYFVCQVCGSTLTELPPDSCPICKSPVSHYKKVESGI